MSRPRWSSRFYGVCLAAAFALACNDTTGPDAQLVHATVQFLELEGGCWTLFAADGTRYQPLDLPQDFRVDGLSVFALVSAVDAGTVCQAGRSVEIVRIALAE